MPYPTCLLSACLVTLSMAGCGKPPPREPDKPPAPRSATHTQLRDAIEQPIDRARQVEGQVQDAAETQRAAIDAASGG